MPILEYQCADCKKTQEVFTPYETVSDCDCGGQLTRAYLTSPSLKVSFKKNVKCQTKDKDGKNIIFTTKHQMEEWGKNNNVGFVHRDNFDYDKNN